MNENDYMTLDELIRQGAEPESSYGDKPKVQMVMVTSVQNINNLYHDPSMMEPTYAPIAQDGDPYKYVMIPVSQEVENGNIYDMTQMFKEMQSEQEIETAKEHGAVTHDLLAVVVDVPQSSISEMHDVKLAFHDGYAKETNYIPDGTGVAEIYAIDALYNNEWAELQGLEYDEHNNLKVDDVQAVDYCIVKNIEDVRAIRLGLERHEFDGKYGDAAETIMHQEIKNLENRREELFDLFDERYEMHQLRYGSDMSLDEEIAQAITDLEQEKRDTTDQPTTEHETDEIGGL